MLSVRLHRAQLELQSHRKWLSLFVAETRCLSTVRPSAFRFIQKNRNGICSLQTQTRLFASGSRNAYATKRLKLNKTATKTVGRPITPSILLELRQAVKDLDIKDVAAIYNAIDKKLVGPSDFRAIAQCLHQCLRVEKQAASTTKRRQELDDMIALAEQLVKDVRQGELAPAGKAHVHLIGFFKESGLRDAGVKFWQWLEGQDDTYVNVDVYGAAIELLAVSGESLSRLEELYQQALNRFPGNFAVYHLSSEALLPDREQATIVGGIPMSLLQAILTARLLHGDTRNAYLALDTALRLYPDQTPPRFFTLFLEERPLLEAYTVFAMACRAGIILPTSQLRHILSILRTSSDLLSPVKHFLAVRAMLSSLYMYGGAGGQVLRNGLNEVVIAMTQILRLQGVDHLEAKQKQQLVNEVMDVVRSTLALFARYGVTPGISAFNSIIANLGGFGHSKQIIGIAVSDMQALKLEPNHVTNRSVVTAAGMLQDTHFLKKAWGNLVEAKESSPPDATDFHILIKAAHAANASEVAKQEYESLKDRLPDYTHSDIEFALNEADFYTLHNDEVVALDLPALFTELKKIRADLDEIDTWTRDRPPVQDFSQQNLPMALLPGASSRSAMSEKRLRDLYDDLTTEQTEPTASSQSLEEPQAGDETEPPPASPSQAALTPTNIPFADIRYDNWKCINLLLEQAETSDRTYHQAVDKAIAAGTVPPTRTLGLDPNGASDVASCGLSDSPRRAKRMAEVDMRTCRENILRLRGRTVGQ